MSVGKAESVLGHLTQTSQGLQVCVEIGRFSGHSTRAEVAAGILALCANGPIHIGPDSTTFVKRARAIMLDIDKGESPLKHRHWKLDGDGDLWYYLYLASEAKDTKGIEFTWVKGHATEEHIIQGVTTWAHKIGNDIADQVVDAGTDLHGTDLCNIACPLFHRSVARTNCMK